jgi:hypothetical protein
MRVLFICKKRVDSYGVSFGLLNSARFVANTLLEHGINSKVITVIDNNQIDKEVHEYKPTHVIIEAYWVIPSKIHILCKKYSKIKWIIRCHSKIPFFAHEGNALKWTREYIDISVNHKNLYISFNDFDTTESICSAFNYHPLYLPNIYNPPKYKHNYCCKKRGNFDFPKIHVGCFGAIRPMKNHLLQAFAAIRFADIKHLRLIFHINSSRIEQEGENVLKNLRNLFFNNFHVIVEHPWVEHEKFIKLVREMDMGLQVSFSESFDIVSADFVDNGIPLIGSYDIQWLSNWYKADANDADDITRLMLFAWRAKKMGIHNINKLYLWYHNQKATKQWLHILKK